RIVSRQGRPGQLDRRTAEEQLLHDGGGEQGESGESRHHVDRGEGLPVAPELVGFLSVQGNTTDLSPGTIAAGRPQVKDGWWGRLRTLRVRQDDPDLAVAVRGPDA